MTAGVGDGHLGDWRYTRIEELVEQYGGTVLCRIGDRVKIRLGDDTLFLRYDDGGAKGPS